MKTKAFIPFFTISIVCIIAIILLSNKKIRHTFLNFSVIRNYIQKKHNSVVSYKAKKYTPQNNEPISLPQSLQEFFSLYDLAPQQIKQKELSGEQKTLLSVSIPQGIPLEQLIWELHSFVKVLNYTVSDCYEYKKGCVIVFSPLRNTDKTIQLTIGFSHLFLKNSSKIAFIIDDIPPDDTALVAQFLQSPISLTLCLPPTQKSLQLITFYSNTESKEICINLPLSPINTTRYADGLSTICVNSSEKEIEEIIKNATLCIPFHSGFTHDQSTMLMEDSRIMNILFQNIKKYNTLFIDKRVNSHTSSLALLAEKNSIEYIKINASLTDVESIDDFENTFKRYILQAQKIKYSIVLVRANRRFLSAIENYNDLFKNNGIQLACISHVITNISYSNSKDSP